MVKGLAKKLFSGGHPQACGQVDQVCYEAGGTMSKNKTQTISIRTLVKKVIIKFMLFNDFPSYMASHVRRIHLAKFKICEWLNARPSQSRRLKIMQPTNK